LHKFYNLGINENSSWMTCSIAWHWFIVFFHIFQKISWKCFSKREIFSKTSVNHWYDGGWRINHPYQLPGHIFHHISVKFLHDRVKKRNSANIYWAIIKGWHWIGINHQKKRFGKGEEDMRYPFHSFFGITKFKYPKICEIFEFEIGLPFVKIIEKKQQQM